MIIFLEGLPGTGKSTNSGLLYRQLERNGLSTKWIHEMMRPHPVLYFFEACLTNHEYDQWCKKYDPGRIMSTIARQFESTVGIDLLEIDWHYKSLYSAEAIKELKGKDVWNFSPSRYKEVALEKWRAFAQEVRKNPARIYILDSCIFQYQIFSFQLVDTPDEELFVFIREIWYIFKELNPYLIYLYRESVDDQIEFIRKVRGEQFFQTIWERDKDNPYYKNRPYGIEAYYEFLRDYDQKVSELFKEAPCPKLSIEITDGKWDKYEADLLQFLNIEFHQEPNFRFTSGIFRNDVIDVSFKIQEHAGGYQLIDPYGVKRQLYGRSNKEWYIQDYPVTLMLNDKDQIVIAGENLTNRWTESGLIFKRSTN
jgi:hypothetical protein